MEKTYNLTNGKVSKQLLGFFFPMLFTNLLQQIYTFIDTVIVAGDWETMHLEQSGICRRFADRLHCPLN